MGSFKDKTVITQILYHPLSTTIPPSVAICTPGIKFKIHIRFLSSSFFKGETFKRVLDFLAVTLLACYSRQQCFIFKKDISTLTGGRRREAFVALISSPVIFSCSGSQMVRFSAHMFVFLRDHHAWPAWHKVCVRR